MMELKAGVVFLVASSLISAACGQQHDFIRVDTSSKQFIDSTGEVKS